MKYLVEKTCNPEGKTIAAGSIVDLDAKNDVVKAYVKSGVLVKADTKED